MLFSGNSRFKSNYLIAMIGSKMKNTYKRYEFSVYDYLQDVFKEKGAVDETDVQHAVNTLRNMVADNVIQTVDREYPNSIIVAEDILKEHREKNTDNILVTGPSVALVYSIVIKMVMGDEYEFRMVSPASVSSNNLEKADFSELTGVMLARFEQYEAEAIRNSLEILVDDGILKSYPDYE